ncbi:MAG: hypothetical protein JSS02_20570 [Planctomycetes bacterium]|nr:hypothetical protein [Planctomycetota bacterium]
MRRFITFCLCSFGLVGSFTSTAHSQEAKESKAIQPAEVKLGRPVDFEKDVYPILDAKCVACHNVAINENGLNLEDVKNIMKGGKRGPAVVPREPDKSRLYTLSTRGVGPAMPPLPNKVEATALTPQELGILRQWILEGANAGAGNTGNAINWQPLPKGVHPIYAVAITADGQYAAAGRGNKVIVYHVPTGETVAQLADPSLLTIQHNGKPMYDAGSSHRDFVHALAISPSGNMVASGSYREIKLWARNDNFQRLNMAASPGAVPAIAVSPDNKWIATASADNTIKLFNLADGQQVRVLSGHSAVVSGLVFSPDSTRLMSSSHDKSWRVWNVADGAALARVDLPAAVNGIAVSHDGAKIAAGSADNFVRLFTAPPAPTPAIAATAAPVAAIRVSPDKKLLALAEADGKITLIDLATGKPVKQLAGHTAAVTSLGFSANGARLVSGSADKTVRVWDVAAGTAVATLTGTTQAITAVALHPNGLQAVSGAADGQTIVWKLDAAAPRALAGDNGAPATVSAVSPDGKQLATAGVANGQPVVFVRDIASGNVTKTLAGHTAPVTALNFSLDNARLISGSADKTARVWNLADGAALAKFEVHTNTVSAVGLNSNGTQAVSGAADNSLKVWNVADGKEIANCAGHAGAVSAALFTPNNQAVISASADQTIRVWNPTNGQASAQFGFGQPVTSLALSVDGQKLAATGTDNNVRLLGLNGQVLFTMAGHTAAPKSVAFSADNLRVVSAGADNLAIAWDAATGALLESLPVPAGLTLARFSTPNNTLVIGGNDKSLAAVTLHFERSLVGNTKTISGLAYSPAGDAIYASSEDGTVRRYNADGNQAWAQNHGAAIHDLALSPDGNLLATAGENNQVRVWQAANGGGGPQAALGGFTAPVKSVAFSLDNLHLASGTANNQIVVHDVKTAAVEQISATHTGAVEALAAAGENGKVFISTGADKTVQSFALLFERQLQGHGGPVHAVAFVPPTSARVISGSEDGTVRIWDVANGNQAGAIGHGGPVTTVAVSADGQRYASGSTNNSAKLWNATNNQQIAELKGDLRNQKQVAELTLDDAEAKAGVQVAMAAIPAAEKTLAERTEAQKKAVEAKTNAEKVATEMAAKFKTASDAKATADKLAADKATEANVAATNKTNADKAATDTAAAAKAAVDAAAKAKEALDKDPNNETLKKAKADADALVTKTADDAKKAADAKAVADKAMTDTAAAAKAAADAKVTTDKAAADAMAASKKADDDKNSATKALEQADKAVKEGTDAVAKSKTDHEASVNRQKAVEASLTAAKAAATEREKPIRAVRFSRDGKELAVAGDNAIISTYDGVTGTAWNVLDGHKAQVLALDYGAGHTLVSGAADQTAKAWDLSPEWKLVGVLGPKKEAPQDLNDSVFISRVLCLDFSPDGKLLASGGGDPSRSGELIIWDVANRTIAKNFEQAHSDTVFGVKFSRDGQQILSGAADKFVKIHDLATGKLVRSFEGHTNHVLGVAWKGDSKFVVSAGADNAIKVWNVETGEQARTIGGYAKQVTSIQYMGRSANIVSCGGDKTVRFHTADNGNNYRNFAGATDFMYAAAASANEQVVIAAGQDGVLRVWNGTNGQVIRTFDPPKPDSQQAAK